MNYTDYEVSVGNLYTWRGGREPCMILYRSSFYIYVLYPNTKEIFHFSLMKDPAWKLL